MNIEDKNRHLTNHSKTYVSGEKENNILILSLLTAFLCIPIFFWYCFLPAISILEIHLETNYFVVFSGLSFGISMFIIFKISVLAVESIYVFKEHKKYINDMSQFYPIILQNEVVSTELLHILNHYIEEGKENPELIFQYNKKHSLLNEYIIFHNFMIND
jgi:hypothetical protein